MVKQSDIAKLFADMPDKKAIAQAKAFLEDFPRSKFSQPVLEFLGTKEDRKDLVKWTLKWLRKNSSARVIYPAMEAIPEQEIVDFARKYVEKLPPDRTDKIFLYLLKNYLDDDLLQTTEKWIAGWGIGDPLTGDILKILLKHKPELKSDAYLESLIEEEDSYGFLQVLLRYSNSKIVVDFCIKYLNLYPGSTMGAFLLGDLLRTRKLKQSKAEELVEQWIESAEHPNSNLLITIFWSYFTHFKTSQFIWNYLRKLGGKNVPKRCWVFRYLTYMDDKNEIEEWLLDWLERNLKHRNAGNLLYELINIVEWNERFRKILKEWMKCTKPGDRESIVSQIIYVDLDEPDIELDEELAMLILEYMEFLEIGNLRLFEVERVIEFHPKRCTKLLKKFCRKEKNDYLAVWKAANMHLKCKHDKQIAKHQIEFLKDLSGGNVLNRLDTLELEAESYELLLDCKESARILPLAESFASKFAHIRPDLCARVRESIDACKLTS